MRRLADAPSPVDGHTDVALVGEGGLARVQTGTRPDAGPLGPRVPGKRMLGRDRRAECARRAREDREELVPLAVDLDAVRLRDRPPQDPAIVLEQRAVLVTPEALEQPRRPLQVDEEEGERSLGERAGGHAPQGNRAGAASKDCGCSYGAPSSRPDGRSARLCA